MSLRPVRAQGHVTIFCIPRLTTLVFRDVSRGEKNCNKPLALRLRSDLDLTLEGEEVALWLLTPLFLAPKEKWKSPCNLNKSLC
jgi:hypothetical protein